jgi:hypothetical protein
VLLPYRIAAPAVPPPCNTTQYEPAANDTPGETAKSTQPAACPSPTDTTTLCAFNAPGTPAASAYTNARNDSTPDTAELSPKYADTFVTVPAEASVYLFPHFNPF